MPIILRAAAFWLAVALFPLLLQAAVVPEPPENNSDPKTPGAKQGDSPDQLLAGEMEADSLYGQDINRRLSGLG